MAWFGTFKGFKTARDVCIYTSHFTYIHSHILMENSTLETSFIEHLHSANQRSLDQKKELELIACLQLLSDIWVSANHIPEVSDRYFHYQRVINGQAQMYPTEA